MKKEMLEQAVLDYIADKFKDKIVNKRVQTFFTYSELVDTVLSFAELLNKNIEELEQMLEQIEKDLAISEHDREHNDYELTEVYKKAEELKEAKEIIRYFVNAYSIISKETLEQAKKFLEEK